MEPYVAIRKKKYGFKFIGKKFLTIVSTIINLDYLSINKSSYIYFNR